MLALRGNQATCHFYEARDASTSQRHIPRSALPELTQYALLDLLVRRYEVLRPNGHSARERATVRVVWSPNQV